MVLWLALGSRRRFWEQAFTFGSMVLTNAVCPNNRGRPPPKSGDVVTTVTLMPVIAELVERGGGTTHGAVVTNVLVQGDQVFGQVLPP